MDIGKFIAKAMTNLSAMANYMCGGHYEPRNPEEGQIGGDLLELARTLSNEVPGTFFLAIDTGNAAFDEGGGGSTGGEIAHILQTLALKVRDRGPEALHSESPFVLRDNNGNRVGTAHFFIKE